MSALAIARRKLAETAASAAPAGASRVNPVSFVGPPPAPTTGPDAAAGAGEGSFVNPVSLVGAPDPAFDGLPATLDGISGRLLASLRSKAAGCPATAREAVALADYLAACDRREVELAGTPACALAREWNRRVTERERSKEQDTSKSRASRPVATKRLV